MSKDNNQDVDNSNQPEIKKLGLLPNVKNELSKVASGQKRNILILIVLSLGALYIAFTIFSNNMPSDSDNNKPEAPKNVVKPTPGKVSDVPPLPKIPTPQKIKEPVLANKDNTDKDAKNLDEDKKDAENKKQNDIPNIALPVIDPPSIAQDNTPKTLPILPTDNNSNTVATTTQSVAPPPTQITDRDLEEQRKQAKWKANIVLVNNSNVNKVTPNNRNNDFVQRGNLDLLLGQGKVIDAVLETAINTDTGSGIRAVVNRDVFSESNKVILIPKGSRVFGTYANDGKGAYGRINITWNRLDLPSGYTLKLDGIGVDNLGRKGTQGRLDDKAKEKFTDVVLSSAFNIMLANVIDKVIAPPTTSEQALQNQSIATNINSIVSQIATSAGSTDAEKAKAAQDICSRVRELITDKTSNAYTGFDQACTNLNVSSTTGTQQFQVIITAASTASAALLTSVTTTNTTTKSQDAAKDAFTNISNTMKDILVKSDVQPTITIDQGANVKIYVNKDYEFPKEAIMKNSLLQY